MKRMLQNFSGGGVPIWFGSGNSFWFGLYEYKSK